MVVPVQPILLLEAGHCHDIPSLAKNYIDYSASLLDPETMDLSRFDLVSLRNGLLFNQTWENPKSIDSKVWSINLGPEYSPWCEDSYQCEDLALLTAEGKFQSSHDEYKDRGVGAGEVRQANYFCTFNDPYKKEVNDRPYGCYLDVKRSTWTYVSKLSHIVENERYTKTGSKIAVQQADCSAEFPCLCTLVNYTNLAQPKPNANSGVAASYCSANANTPQCCEYVRWPLVSTCIIPFLTMGYLVHSYWSKRNNIANISKKDKQIGGALLVMLFFQTVGALWGIAILMR